MYGFRCFFKKKQGSKTTFSSQKGQGCFSPTLQFKTLLARTSLKVGNLINAKICLLLTENASAFFTGGLLYLVSSMWEVRTCLELEKKICFPCK